MDAYIQGLGLVLDPYVLLVMLLAGGFGLFMGAVPGLSATMATALLVPVTFFMEPVPAVAAIVSATAAAIFAGDVPGVLLRIPGTPASAAYTDEAYRMTQKGEAELALGVCLVTSVIGGLFGAVVLMLAAPLLAEFALGFSSFEYFWLALLGLTSAAFVASDRPLRGLVSLLLGLLLAGVGMDPISGFARFTFGSVDLMAGVNLIPAMVGMFAVTEVLRGVTRGFEADGAPTKGVGNVFKGLGRVLARYKLNLLRGNVLGTIIGALPGAGADIAAWISYALARRFSKEPEKFGTGHVEGLVDAGASNNSALAGAWIPAMVFGIPGDSITAIVIGVLYMKGMNPGPTVFLEQPQFVYAVFLAFFVANLMMLPLGWAAIKAAKPILAVPRDLLMPVILLFCVVGSFAINNAVFDVGVMLAVGLVAWLMEENGFPVAPIILGLVLGPLVEQNFLTSMIKADGELIAFFERPVAAVLGVLTLAVWLYPLVGLARRREREAAGGRARSGAG